MEDTNVNFEAALDSNPADWPLRLIYADYLEEQGELEQAAVQRWMGKARRCPYKVSYSSQWGWFSWTCASTEDFSKIPITVLMTLPGYGELAPGYWQACFVSRHQAELALATAIHLLETADWEM